MANNKGTVRILRERCKGCGYCIITCPKGCLTEGVEINLSGYIPPLFIKPDRCTACTLCAIMCPDIAIEVYKIEMRV